MIVNNFNDRNCGHPVRIDPIVCSTWERFVARCKNEPVGMNEADGVLLASPARELVPAFWPGRRYQR